MIALGTGFEEWNGIGVCEFLGCCKVHNLLLVKVTLVAYQHFVHMFMAVPINLRKPTLNCSETVLICDVINHDDTVCPPVVAAGDGAEALLPSGVPNLQLDDLAIDLDGTDFKIDTDCANVCLGVGIVSEAQEQAGLADA